MIVAVAGLASCKAKTDRVEYSNSPDSGAVAPAARLDTSLRNATPDTTGLDTARKRP